MTAVQDDVATVDAKFAEILDFCLGCRACEPICPGMVPYGSLLEGARAEIVVQQSSIGRRLRGLLTGRLIASTAALNAATVVLSVIQRLGLWRALPRRFRRSISGLRPLKDRKAGPKGIEGGTVGLLTGCIQAQWFPGVNNAAVELLTLAGIAVGIPTDQNCCGALAAHDGHADSAQKLARGNANAFVGYDRIVATAAGCSAHLRDIDPSRAVDITVVVAEAIAAGQLPRLKPDRGPAVVQDPCHLRHAQRVVDEPREILRAAGYTVIELDDNGMCCGAAGLYTLLQPVASAQLGESKANLVRETGCTLVASANPGCEMQLRSQLGPEFRIAHPIELYLEALATADMTTNVATVETES